jgi:hypothetical protein
MKAKRFGGVVRVGPSPAMALSDSSQGKATVAPRPFRITRRDICGELMKNSDAG